MACRSVNQLSSRMVGGYLRARMFPAERFFSSLCPLLLINCKGHMEHLPGSTDRAWDRVTLSRSAECSRGCQEKSLGGVSQTSTSGPVGASERGNRSLIACRGYDPSVRGVSTATRWLPAELRGIVRIRNVANRTWSTRSVALAWKTRGETWANDNTISPMALLGRLGTRQSSQAEQQAQSQ